MIHQHAKNFNDFKKLMNTYIQWHIKTISESQGGEQLWNEVYETKMGVNVRERTIHQQP